MDGSHNLGSKPTNRTRRLYAQFGPVVWIAVLLGAWFVIGEWRVLPEMVNATMAALP